MQELSPPANCPDLNYPVYSVTPQHAIQPNYESSNSPKYFRCSYRGCLREFSTTWQFDIHFAFHTQNSRFSCSRCSQKFSRAVDLTRHERLSHSVFTCRRCEQVFSCRNLMDDHICGDQKLVATLKRRPDWRTIARPPPVVAPVVVYARVPQQNCP
ncbi:hypothetical protein BDR26DRAFT_623139 [Obelidium mucronatum]|nr:hypothetical protein BDR26DRAFT_623139 [Obelidium mucronatum]